MASNLDPNKRTYKWYFHPISVIMSIIILGPFAIPLICVNPALKRWHKVAAILIIVLVTLWTIKLSVDIVKIVLKEMKSLQEILQ